MKKAKIVFVKNLSVILYFILIYFISFNAYSSNFSIQYIFPFNDAEWIIKESPIIVRFNNILSAQIANRENFIQVLGSQSGNVNGETVLSSDNQTLIFYPDISFIPGEKVTVNLCPRLNGQPQSFLDTTYSFLIAPAKSHNYVKPEDKDVSFSVNNLSKKRYTPNKDGIIVLNGISVPSDFPYIDITINDNPDSGYIFCNYAGDKYYNLILDNTGAPIFYWIVPDDRRDFKVQPTGVITMTVRENFGGGGYIAIDNTYTVVDTFFAPPGYMIDEHELLVLPNGHYLVTAMDTRIIDMSEIVPGGKRNANVIGYHLIEMDARDHPVFIWRCWDHYDITDAEYVDLTQRNIDFLHTNSIAVDHDGNYLISPKLLNEITKIDKNSGDIIWRLGGKKNQFEYIGFDEFISMQHSIRVLDNGNYTVFDNGNYHTPHYSRALEFKVNANDMTVTKIWEFRDTPDKQSFYKGNVQRLLNGNTLICWGMENLPKLTEVRPDGSKAFEMNFVNPVQCYRVFRFPWQGKAVVPFLVAETTTDKATLLFNKFGDSDVKEYRIYGGPHSESNTLIATTSSPYIQLDERHFTQGDTYFFRVTAVDSYGNECGFSNEERVKTSFIPVNTNIVNNGDFDAGMTAWILDVSSPALANCFTNNQECTIDIQQNGADFDDIRLRQNNLTLYQGQTYFFEFDAWTDFARAIDAKIESSNPPYTNYGKIGLTYINTSKKHYVFQFQMENATTHQARIVFNVGSEKGVVNIDNVVLLRTEPSKVTQLSATRSLNFFLNPIYPNPFNSSTNIEFNLPEECYVKLEILDILGRVVQTVYQERLPAGQYTRRFSGHLSSSGKYFCRMRAESVFSSAQYSQIRSMVHVK